MVNIGLQTTLSIPSSISEIEVNHQATNVVLAATNRDGVFRSTNHGLSWNSSNTNLLDDDVQTMRNDADDEARYLQELLLLSIGLITVG